MNPIRIDTQGEPIRPQRIPEASRPFIHPLSAVLLMVVDSLWTLADWAAAFWIITIPLSFVVVAFPTLLIQKFLNHDSLLRALPVAAFLGVLAAVPTPIMGTAMGASVLALAGWRRFHH